MDSIESPRSTTTNHPTPPNPTGPSRAELLDKAISLLNNHLPMYGTACYMGDSSFQEPPDRQIDRVPGPIRAELDSALLAAAKYARKTFDQA